MTLELLVSPAPTLAPPASCSDFTNALLAGDRRRCAELTQRALEEGAPVPELYEQLFQRALYRVGKLWECNQISVATEHQATSIVEGLLNQIFPRIISSRRVGKRIVVGSVAGELHQVGGKMVCDVFEMHGWDACYLGANTPAGELSRLLREQPPDLVGLSLSVYFHVGVLRGMVDAIRAEFPALPILIGGQGLRHIGPTLIQDPMVHYLADLHGLSRFVAALGQ
jgi:methanogenic corrinoid protein MtbC1